MNDQSLDDLLRAAGHGLAWPEEARPDLAERVLRLHSRRRRRRRAVGGVAVMLLIGGVAWVGLSWFDLSRQPQLAEPHTPQPATRPELLRAELARLDAEARRRRAAAMRLLDVQQPAADPQDAAPQAAAEPEPVGLMDEELEKAAFLMVDYAQNRVARGQEDLATAEYRRVVQLFPNTSAAETARKSLTRTSPEEGDL